MNSVVIVVTVTFLMLINAYEFDEDLLMYTETFRKISDEYNRFAKSQNYTFPNELEFELKFTSKGDHDNHYDFIVVGSGSSGAVVASRLSENPHWKVLLIEAGKVESALNRIPLVSLLFILSDYNWKYLLEPQPGMARAFKQQRFHLPRGKALGGSTVINQMIYSRGNPLDYDLWEAQGNPGWSYKDVLPYFLRAEMCQLHHVNHEYHNRHGKVSVERSFVPKLVHGFVKAGGEMGYQEYNDYNTPYQYGFSPMQATLLNGERHSVARAYLFPAFHRDNLYVKINAMATKVLIDHESKKAYGVEYYHRGQLQRAFARKEVVLSAGAINTPQLLILSGVGPRKHLQELGVPLVKDLPVGETMYDHMSYPGLIFTFEKNLTYTRRDLFNLINLKYYIKTHQGLFRSLAVDGIGFINTNLTQLDRPDIEIQITEGTQSTDLGVYSKPLQRIRHDFYKAYYSPFVFLRTVIIFPMLLHPKSTGHVKLRSADPFDHPLIYGNYLTDAKGDDMKTLIAGIRFIVNMSKTDTFRRLGIRLLHARVFGCGLIKYQSDEYWECAIRTLAYASYHQTSTAKMGPPSDPKSVVDHELKVHGIKGLRVADCSAFPVTLGAHTNAPAIMLGEKASDLIRDTWSNAPHSSRHQT